MTFLDQLLPSLISAVLSGTVVGLFLAVFNKKLDQSVEDSKRVNRLEMNSVKERADQVGEKVLIVDKKVETLTQQVNGMDKRLAIIATEQKYTSENLVQLRHELEKVAAERAGYGRVIKKQ